jgi:hypothetical protein
MARSRRLPAAYDEADSSPAAHNDNHHGEGQSITFERVEPSRLGLFLNRWWRRTVFLLQAGVVVGLLAAYPAATFRSHHIDDTPILLSGGENWSMPEAGVAITKIARELEGTGWAADRANWHPQARLVAMPAWQSATANALAEHTAIFARQVTDSAAGEDKDLHAAALLLTEEAGTPMRPRLTAAAEALNRFDARLAHGLVKMPSRTETMKEQASLFARWAKNDRAVLSRQISAGSDRLPATRTDIETYYAAKARAHVAASMLAALREHDANLRRFPAIEKALADSERAWNRVSRQRPVIVANMAGDSLLRPNNLASLGYFMVEAERASAALETTMAAVPAGGLETVAEVQPALPTAAAAAAAPALAPGASPSLGAGPGTP